jgi:hypothetical protein
VRKSVEDKSFFFGGSKNSEEKNARDARVDSVYVQRRVFSVYSRDAVRKGMPGLLAPQERGESGEGRNEMKRICQCNFESSPPGGRQRMATVSRFGLRTGREATREKS